MDSFIKRTTGDVIQKFERNSSGKFVCVSQEFFCSDLCEYVDDNGDLIDPPDYEYQSYDMVVENDNKLISAAPALLEACKLLRAALTEYKLRDIKKRFSLCVADAEAGKAIVAAESN